MGTEDALVWNHMRCFGDNEVSAAVWGVFLCPAVGGEVLFTAVGLLFTSQLHSCPATSQPFLPIFCLRI